MPSLLHDTAPVTAGATDVVCIACHTSHVTRHTSHVTRHTSHLLLYAADAQQFLNVELLLKDVAAGDYKGFWGIKMGGGEMAWGRGRGGTRRGAIDGFKGEVGCKFRGCVRTS